MGKATALIADGDFGFAELLAARLGTMGYATMTASDGEEALRTARRERPVLVVADEALARLDGFKLCRLLKFDKPRSAMTVVLMSGAVTEENQQLAEAVRAGGYVAKHVDNPDLLSIAQTLLGKD